MAGNINGNLQERYAYFRALTPDFSQEVALEEALRTLSQPDLNTLARFAIEEVTDAQFGDEAQTLFERFFPTFGDMAGDVLVPKEMNAIQILYTKRCGVDARTPQPIQQAFQVGLFQFLGDADVIDTIDTMQKAKDVASMLFAGRRNIPDNVYAKHLARLIQVVDKDGDLPLIQRVMHKLREAQEAYFTRHGFALREKAYPEANGLGFDDAVEVVIPFARRAFEGFQAKFKGADGSYYNGSEKPGIPVHLVSANVAEAQLQQEARMMAHRHYDDPVLVKAKVPENFIVEGVMLASALDEMEDIEIVPLEKGNVDFIAREDLAPLYPGVDASVITQLDALLFEKVVPPRDPDPVQGWSETQKKLAKAAVAVIAGFLLYKYVAKPLYPKIKDWWYTSSPVKGN